MLPCSTVPFQEMPTYNEKRRQSSTAQNMLRCRSVQSLNLLYSGNKSASTASLSLAQYSSSGNLFETEMMGGSRYDSDSPRSMSISSGAGSSSGKSYDWRGHMGDVYHYVQCAVVRDIMKTFCRRLVPLPPLLTVPNYKWYCGHATHSLSLSPQSCFAFITTCAHTATCDIPMQDKLF